MGTYVIFFQNSSWLQKKNQYGLLHSNKCEVSLNFAQQNFCVNCLKIFFSHPPSDPYNSTFWLAGSDLRHHGQWEWFPEEDFVVFKNWLPDQEDSPTRHCMQMSLYNNFKWFADNCMQNRKFICEHLSTSKSPFGWGMWCWYRH